MLRFLILSLLFWRLAHFATEGFILSRIYAPLPEGGAEWSESSPLEQPYRYLGSGSQSFVFESEDGRYVLKFFKEHRWRLYPWLTAKGIKRRVEGKADTYKSAALCLSHLKEETGLLYVHLGQTSSLPLVTVKDPNGIAHKLNLNGIPFVLQKKGEPLQTLLERLLTEGKREEAKQAMVSVLKLIAKQRYANFNDKDPNPLANFGFIDGRAVELDIGGIIIDRLKDRDYFFHYELGKIEAKMRKWLEKRDPDLFAHFKLQINEMIASGSTTD